ncbi:MAG: hypothetical protein RJB66_2003 [Pseudomonadota bacterium]|jgi:hypothetical protein
MSGLNQFKYAFGLVAALLFFSACSFKNRWTDPTTTINKTEKTKIVVTSNMSADEIADAAEQLVTPYTFMLADKTFSLALEKNPAHNKALFYKALLKRFMVFKGILARIRPLIEQKGEIQSYNSQLRQIPESALKSFLLDGPADINSYYSAQTFLNKYVRGVNYLREFLLQNPELNFDIYLNPYFHKDTIATSWSKSCKQLITQNELMHVECDSREVATRHVNSADLMLLRQMAAGEVLAFSVYASYSFEGIESLSQIKDFDRLPYKTQKKIIQSHDDLGVLRRDHVMDLIQYIAQDFVAAVRWSEMMQKELCPRHDDDSSGEDQRANFLFSKGLCLSSKSEALTARENLLAKIETALRGTLPIEVPRKDEEMTFQTVVDPLVISRRPIIDLKSLIPNEISTCGRRTPLSDPTLNGLFPRGDAPEYLGLKACY